MDMWDILAIEPTSDVKAIKKAYARKLKTIDQNLESDKFMALRDAYNKALNWSTYADYDYDYDYDDEHEHDEGAVEETNQLYIQETLKKSLFDEYASIYEDENEKEVIEKVYYKTLNDHLSDFKFRMNENAWMDYYMNRDVFDSHLIAYDMETLLNFVQNNPVLPKSVWQFVHLKILEFKRYSFIYTKDHFSRLALAIKKTNSRMTYSFIEELDLEMDENRLAYYETLFTKINQVVIQIDSQLYKEASKMIKEIELVEDYQHKNLKLLKLYLMSKSLSKEAFERTAINFIKKYREDESIKITVFDMGLDCKDYRLCKRLLGKLDMNLHNQMYLIQNMRILIRRPNLMEALKVSRKLKKVNDFTELEVENLKKLGMEFHDHFTLNANHIQFFFIVRALDPHWNYLSGLNTTDIARAIPYKSILKQIMISIAVFFIRAFFILLFIALSFGSPFFLFGLIFMVIEMFKKDEK